MEKCYLKHNTMKTFDEHGFKVTTGLPGFMSVQSIRNTTFVLSSNRQEFEEVNDGWHQILLENGVTNEILTLTIVRKQ